MSAIDFEMHVGKKRGPKGDRVVVPLGAKFLAYRKWQGGGPIIRRMSQPQPMHNLHRRNGPPTFEAHSSSGSTLDEHAFIEDVVQLDAFDES